MTIDKESKKWNSCAKCAPSVYQNLYQKGAKSFQDIVQEDGIKALKAALCGPNPQHVIIYGPPGVGKTAAARLVLKKRKT